MLFLSIDFIRGGTISKIPPIAMTQALTSKTIPNTYSDNFTPGTSCYAEKTF